MNRARRRSSCAPPAFLAPPSHEKWCPMKLQIPVIVFLALSSTTDVRADEARPPMTGPERDIGSEVRGVFAAKCAACHGPDLAKPKGRFGYVLDLRRVAGNPEMVIPSRPDESELWVLVNRGEMPPPDSPHGPLTTAEKETVRSWIATGAPDVKPLALGSSATDLPDPPSPAPVSVPTTDRVLRFMGKFHLLALHLPIALMLAAGLGEIVSVWRRSREPSAAVQFCLPLAALAAVPTVALGWFHAAAGNGVGSPQLLLLHRWLGTVAGAWVIGTAGCAEWDARRGFRSRGVRAALAVGITLVAAAAHIGGLMAHGRDFFDW